MPDEKPPLPSPLIKITDVLGLSEPGKRLVDAIVHGVGEWAYPWQRNRNTRADIDAFKQWSRALRKEGLPATSIELSLEQRAALRVSSQEVRRQQNREAIAAQAVTEFQDARLEKTIETFHTLETEWLDRFWRLAEDVSQQDAQSLWGRILARQSTGASAFSARCLEMLSTLSRAEAKLLEQLATKVACFERPNAGGLDYSIIRSITFWMSPGADQPGLTEANRNLSREVGNAHEEIFGPIGIFVESGWAHEVVAPVQDQIVRFNLGNQRFHIGGYPAPLPPNAYIRIPDAVCVGAGIQLSPVGAEIVSLIRAEPTPGFIKLLGEALREVGLTLEPE
jgi:hypothetical protein